MTNSRAQRGSIALYVLVFSAVSIILLSGFVIWADFNLRAVFRDFDSAQAFMIAEAGIEYYRWHLSHNRTDYTDGTGQPGPYIHEFRNKDGTVVGNYSLDITAPLVGSTVVTLTSTGTVVANPGTARIIEARMAIPSLAKYSAVINDYVRFGEGTEIFGPVHSNYGIRVDGTAYNIVTSSIEKYNDPDHSGQDEFGVHTHRAPVDPQPPAPVPDRPDVFKAGRKFPVAPVDFAGLTKNIANIKEDAKDDGFYVGPSGQGNEGYHIVLKTNDTFDLYRVTDTVKPPNGCVDVIGQQDWGTWTIKDETFLGNHPLPVNGLIFVEDHAWVDGRIDGARVTIAAGKFPENPANHAHITVNRDLLYTSYDGTDVIGLIAQGNISVGLDSEDDLRIDGALIAQNDRVGRHYYRPPSGIQDRCAPYHIRQRITLFGMFASGERYGFAYSDGTGYQERIIIYDANLLYAPPASFPLTADFYTPIFWSERQ